MSKEDRIKETLQFVEDVFTSAKSSEEEKWTSLISLADEYAKEAKKIKNKYPYHVNPIEELHANENANSRILCGMLQYQLDGKYKILESFVKRFFPDATISIGEKPTIEPEQFRIDLSIRELGKYALIFENKIHDAVLQKNQLARYINKLIEIENFKREQIYVVFLPSTSDYEPNDCCWHNEEECCKNCNGECKFKDKEPLLRKKFENAGRYKKVTFREDILSWLKDDVLPNVLYKETLLQSAVVLYIDYLEGLFNLRTIERDMIMELEQIVIEQLGLKGKDALEQIDVLDEKLQNIEELSKTIESYKQRIISKTLCAEIEKIAKRIVNIRSELVFELSDDNVYFKVGFRKKEWNLFVVFSCYTDGEFFIYVGTPNEEKIEWLSSDKCILDWKNISKRYPYGWKYLVDYNKNVIKLLSDMQTQDDKIFKFMKEELEKILICIEENNISMSSNA